MDQNVGSVDQGPRTTVGAAAGALSVVALAGAVSIPTVLSPVLGVVVIVMLSIDSYSRNSTSS